MSEQGAKSLLLTCFLLAIAIVSWDEIKHGGMFPRPRRFIGAGLVFGILGFAAPVISVQVASVLGAGMVLALLYKGVIGMGPGVGAVAAAGAAAGATAGQATRQLDQSLIGGVIWGANEGTPGGQ